MQKKIYTTKEKRAESQKADGKKGMEGDLRKERCWIY